jgi:hypothetical protein
MAQAPGAAQAAADIGERQPRPDRTGGHRLEQAAQTPTMHLGQQRLEAAV